MKDERNIRLIAGVDLQNCRRLRAIVIAAPAVENVWPPMVVQGGAIATVTKARIQQLVACHHVCCDCATYTWMDGWVDGWMDGRTDGSIDRQRERDREI